MRFVVKPGGIIVLVIAILTLSLLAFFKRDRIVEKIVEKTVTVAAPTPEPTPKVQASANLVQNGGMDDKDASNTMPAFWGALWVGHGKLNVVRDTKTFKSYPASLRMESADGKDVKGQVAQPLNGVAGKVFRVQGVLKIDGNPGIQVALQPRTADGKMLPFQQVVFKAVTSDWEEFHKDITLPAGSTGFNIVLYMDGTGKVWLDDVQVRQIFAATPSP